MYQKTENNPTNTPKAKLRKIGYKMYIVNIGFKLEVSYWFQKFNIAQHYSSHYLEHNKHVLCLTGKNIHFFNQ